MVAVLFARADSIYKTLPGCDVWDKERDALRWPGGCPVVAHPPCRAWGRLRMFSQPEPGEKELALWAVRQVRANGGVLEHPRGSLLWPAAELPWCGFVDAWGGWTYAAPQMWWGHRADKATWFYIVGCAPDEMPPVPLVLGTATHCVRPGRKYPRTPSITKPEREHTPVALATWLCDVARRCAPHPDNRNSQPKPPLCAPVLV